MPVTSQNTPTAPGTPDLKAKHRAMWATGDYPAVADQVIPSLGPVLVDACEVSAGQRVLDVAAGSGNAAVPAAQRGATVVASDLTPELLESGREHAARAGVTIEWREGDAEALPFADDEFDVVMSCVGVMFAPHHQESADELVRVTKAGGTIGLVAWTPAGFIGRMFATMKPFVAPPPAGVQPPPLWGDEAHVRELLGDRVSDVVARRQMLRVDRFADGAEFRDFFKATYGPTIAAYKGIGDDPARVAELDAALAALGDDAIAAHRAGTDAAGTDRVGTDGAEEGPVMEWEYLLLTARVR